MIQLLTWLLDGIKLIGIEAAYGAELAAGAVIAAIVLAYTAAVALLPSMPDAPVIGNPQWLAWLNWFYPFADLVAGLGALLSMWASFLAVRYVLRFVRGL